MDVRGREEAEGRDDYDDHGNDDDSEDASVCEEPGAFYTLKSLTFDISGLDMFKM